MKTLSKSKIQENLETFTAFHTRYYKSDYGRQSSEWLLQTVRDMIEASGASKYEAYADHFNHPWDQNSIIATIPGKTNSTIIVSAHQDSINILLPSALSAPGADDDGSGSMMILEVLRTLLTSKEIIKGEGENTVEFHWYAAEEGGLLGSQAIFSEYEKTGRDIKAMLHHDQIGFIQRSLEAGNKDVIGVIADYGKCASIYSIPRQPAGVLTSLIVVDPSLTEFTKKIITEVRRGEII
jgi:leucyl aminopeptidase